MYHKPLPSLSDVAVPSHPSNCVVPFYAGYEKHEKFNPEDRYTSPLEMPFSEALKRGYDWFNGYGFIGLGNKQPNWRHVQCRTAMELRQICHVSSIERD